MLTREQANRIQNVIAEDATIRFSYQEIKGTCVLGGLAVAADIELPEQVNAQIAALDGFADALAEEYGLTIDQLDQLQYMNDCIEEMGARRRGLIDLVERWAVPSKR